MPLEPAERPSKKSVIESCDLFQSLAFDQRERLLADSRMAHAGRGETIWTAGAPPESVAVVGQGFVKMTKDTAQGSEIAIELVGPGQCIGVLAAIEGRPMPLNAVAVTPTWYLKVPTRTLLGLYDEASALKDQVVKSIAPRLRKAHEMMSRLSSGTVEERIAAVLLILAESYGRRDSGGVVITVPLTRQDLSEMAGTTVETAIRVMSRWQKEGIIATEHRIITICDPAGLERCLSRA